jgi:hypothetical protein
MGNVAARCNVDDGADGGGPEGLVGGCLTGTGNDGLYEVDPDKGGGAGGCEDKDA